MTTIRIPEEKDVISDDRAFRWFFHFHSEAEQGRQTHGYFHIYVGPQYFGEPASQKPSHIIAVELDSDGDLDGFFVPNSWTTDEHMRAADELKAPLLCFMTVKNSPSRLLDLWLAALTTFFSAEISELISRRDLFLNNMSASSRAAYLSDRQIDRICEWKV